MKIKVMLTYFLLVAGGVLFCIGGAMIANDQFLFGACLNVLGGMVFEAHISMRRSLWLP